MFTISLSLLSASSGLANGHMKEGKFQKWRRRFSESLLRLGSSSGSLENRSPSRSPSAHLSNSTNRPRSLVRGIWHGVCDLSLSIHVRLHRQCHILPYMYVYMYIFTMCFHTCCNMYSCHVLYYTLYCVPHVQSLQRVDMVTGGRQRNNTISGPAYASVGPSFMTGIHHVAAKNFGSTGNLDSRHGRVTRRRSLGVVGPYM